MNFKFWKQDLSASVVVFLVALPLCLGIALASDAPLIAGIITGVIGGIVVSMLSGSEMSVSGPAAGLAVIVASGIKDAGSFQAFCLAVMIAGLIQILFSVMKVGKFGQLFPIAVIEGMLASIGFIIILKQLPHLMGGSGAFEDEMNALELLGPDAPFQNVLRAIFATNPVSLFIGTAGILLMILWESLAKKILFFKFVPGALGAVCLGIISNIFATKNFPEFALTTDAGQMVNLPKIEGFSGVSAMLQFPDWNALSNPVIWKIAITIAIVASIESLLSVQASDKLDPERRISSTNKEMVAQGVGNFLSGLVGGIPLTSVIVRSSANIYAGAKTRMSAFFHGILLLLAVLMIPNILNMIPLAALAAVLIRVGYKLTSVHVFKKMFAHGPTVFIPFIITFVAVFATDLLVGVLIGFCFALGIILKNEHVSAITMVNEGSDYMIRLTRDVSFVNKIRLKDMLMQIPEGSSLAINGSNARFIDHDIYEIIHEFKETARHKNIHMQLHNVAGKGYPRSFKRKAKI